MNDDRKTLRDFGFTECSDHPLRTGRDAAKCAFCGAEKVMGLREEWRGSSVDYEMEPLFREVLKHKIGVDKHISE